MQSILRKPFFDRSIPKTRSEKVVIGNCSVAHQQKGSGVMGHRGFLAMGMLTIGKEIARSK